MSEIKLGIIQLQVLNKILHTKDKSIISLNHLTDDYFSDYKDEFNYIKLHLDKYGNVPDIETFVSVFKDFEVFDVNESTQYLVEELIKDKNTRYLASNFNKIRELLMTNKIDEAIRLYQKSSENMVSPNVFTCVDLLKDTSRYDDYIERTQDFSKYYITTGLKELDAILGGWDRQEELATIVARTNVGKSWIMLLFATAAVKQGLNVGIYSGEMSERKVGYRFDTLVGHISNGGMTHGNSSIQVEYKKYIDNLATMFPNASLKVLTPKMIGGYATVSVLRTFIERENLDILFVDQYSLMEDENRARTTSDKTANISKDLKNLQVLEQRPIIAVSQQNREKTEDGTQNTTQIAQSDRIGQDATTVLFLDRENDVLNINIGKSRDSEKGQTLSYSVDFNKGSFVYIPSEDDGLKTNTEEYEHRYDVEPNTGDQPF